MLSEAKYPLCPLRETLRFAQGDNLADDQSQKRFFEVRETLRFAHGDNTVLLLFVKIHHCPLATHQSTRGTRARISETTS